MLNRRAWLRTYGSAAICGSVGAANVFFASSGRIAVAGPMARDLLVSWNDIARKLVDMAEDFPEDKYRLAAGAWCAFVRRTTAARGRLRDVCRRERERPPSGRGGSCACELQVQGGDRGVRETRLCRWRKVDCRPERRATAMSLDVGLPAVHRLRFMAWDTVVEHSGEHYGQLVVYYRLNNLVPPESRPKK